MPTFCRHNRFIERCPICSKTLPGNDRPGGGASRRAGARAASTGASPRRRTSSRAGGGRGGAHEMRVRREGRAVEDGYSCELVPGLRASADAARLAQEMAFSSARLQVLAVDPPGLYGEARQIATSDLEAATWICFLTACLGPVEGDEPFGGIRRALAVLPAPGEIARAEGLPGLLEGIPLGPRSCAQPGAALSAYGEWVRRGGAQPDQGGSGPQARAFTGDPTWTPQRRFERLYERLALPGLSRTARYELLVSLGRLGLYELRPDSLHLGGVADATVEGAKRVFGIADPLLLERRARALTEAASMPVETLDLALANWSSQQRSSGGIPPQTRDETAEQLAGEALGL